MKENDGENVASTREDEITVRDTITDNGSIPKTADDTKREDLQVPAPETASLEPIEVASGRLVSDIFYSCVKQTVLLSSIDTATYIYMYLCIFSYRARNHIATSIKACLFCCGWNREELVSKAFYLDSGLASLQSPFKVPAILSVLYKLK